MPKQTRRRLHKRKKTRRRGGAYVASGTYGCGFRPALRCEANNVRRPGVFSKLSYPEEADKEVAVRDVLTAIDPYKVYFVYPTEICKTKQVPDPENHVERCELGGKSVLPNYSRMRILQMQDGGNSPDTQGLTIYSSFVPLFLASYINLFTGLIMLHNNDLFHNDIKTTNITLGNAGGNVIARFIDFGLMVSPRNLDNLAKDESSVFRHYGVFKTSYAYHSFDMKFLDPTDFEPSNFYDEKPDKDEIATIEAEKAAIDERSRQLTHSQELYKAAMSTTANAGKPAIQAEIYVHAHAIKDLYIQYVTKHNEEKSLRNFSIDEFYTKAVDYRDKLYPNGIFLNDDDDVTRRIDLDYVSAKHESLAETPVDVSLDGDLLTGLVQGSLEYAAMHEKMQLIARQRRILRNSDIYALGRTLSEIICKLLQQRDTGVETPIIQTANDVYQETDEVYQWQWLQGLTDQFTVPFYELVRKMMDPVYDPPSLTELRDEYIGLIEKTPALLGGNIFANALAGPHPYYNILAVPVAVE